LICPYDTNLMTMLAPDFEQLLAALIASPSVSSNTASLDMSNRGVIDLLANWLNDLGFDCEILPLSSNPRKANLIATLGKGDGGLVLSGHTDTVPFDHELWQSDPFTLTTRNNRFYGLGATDMKGFFPVAIEAAKTFIGHKQQQKKLQQPLIILATADEESSMSGARELVSLGRPKARAAIIGEPTGLKAIRAHKGVMMEAVHVQGRSGHSSNPALGNNALEAMRFVLEDLLAFRDEMQTRYNNPQFSVPTPTLNLGCIHGGDNPNRICGECEVHFDIRTLPGMDADELRMQLTVRLQPLAEKLGVNISLRALTTCLPAFAQAADSELVKIAEKLTGHGSESVLFGTEGPYLQQLGMDTIVMGPGSIDQAHQPDEFLAHEQIEPAIAIYRRMIEQYCL
jgi:acetylornithine deacetylase